MLQKKFWESREDFITDCEVQPIGYQANLVAVDKGLFYFNHSCDGTMSIRSGEFADFTTDPSLLRIYTLQGTVLSIACTLMR